MSESGVVGPGGAELGGGVGDEGGAVADHVGEHWGGDVDDEVVQGCDAAARLMP